MPGDWYNPSQISHILSLLNQKHCEKQEKLSFCIFNSGNLFFDELIEEMIGQKYKKCECLIEKNDVICVKCNKHIKSVGIIALTRIGL